MHVIAPCTRLYTSPRYYMIYLSPSCHQTAALALPACLPYLQGYIPSKPPETAPCLGLQWCASLEASTGTIPRAPGSWLLAPGLLSPCLLASLPPCLLGSLLLAFSCLFGHLTAAKRQLAALINVLAETGITYTGCLYTVTELVFCGLSSVQFLLLPQFAVAPLLWFCLSCGSSAWPQLWLLCCGLSRVRPCSAVPLAAGGRLRTIGASPLPTGASPRHPRAAPPPPQWPLPPPPHGTSHRCSLQAWGGREGPPTGHWPLATGHPTLYQRYSTLATQQWPLYTLHSTLAIAYS